MCAGGLREGIGLTFGLTDCVLSDSIFGDSTCKFGIYSFLEFLVMVI
jgi:hypothetical protein